MSNSRYVLQVLNHCPWEEKKLAEQAKAEIKAQKKEMALAKAKATPRKPGRPKGKPQPKGMAKAKAKAKAKGKSKVGVPKGKREIYSDEEMQSLSTPCKPASKRAWKPSPMAKKSKDSSPKKDERMMKALKALDELKLAMKNVGDDQFHTPGPDFTKKILA